MSSKEKQTGTVKWFHNIKGYGFISSEMDEEIFVHYSEINSEGFKKLKRGEKVEFFLDSGDKGLLARDVSLVGTSEEEDYF
ncbi:MAG: cold shock domain-containing protein [Balneola sp.]|nr:MAG: cold shock domain-containing protein [Balneola sp.]